MAEPLTQRPFEAPLMALNADAKRKPKRATVTRIHPTVIVRRPKSSRERAQEDPDRALVDVSQPRQSPLLTAVPEPEPASVAEEPEPVAAKKNKRSPESIAKQKATLAKKKRGKKREPRTGAKKAFVLAHPDVGAHELVKLAAKEGMKILPNYIYTIRASDKKSNGAPRAPKRQRQSHGPSSNGTSIGDLLQAIVDATSEIQRRLSQLTL